jgi:hypothetical protein
MALFVNSCTHFQWRKACNTGLRILWETLKLVCTNSNLKLALMSQKRSYPVFVGEKKSVWRRRWLPKALVFSQLAVFPLHCNCLYFRDLISVNVEKEELTLCVCVCVCVCALVCVCACALAWEAYTWCSLKICCFYLCVQIICLTK